MTIWVDTVVGGGLSFIVTYATRRRDLRKAGVKKQKPPNLECGCDHHLSSHSPQTGKCMAAVDVRIYRDGVFDHFDKHSCACQQYTGDRPITGFYVPNTYYPEP